MTPSFTRLALAVIPSLRTQLRCQMSGRQCLPALVKLLTCKPLPIDATSTSVSDARSGVEVAAARSRICASMIENTRSMPTETPTAGTSFPENMPTSLS